MLQICNIKKSRLVVSAASFASHVLRKAEWLVETRKIRRVREDLFFVHSGLNGDMSGWTVRVWNADGRVRLTCTCLGFFKRGICAHSIAVLMLLSREKARSWDS
jgi:hypothetical protein